MVFMVATHCDYLRRPRKERIFVPDEGLYTPDYSKGTE